MENMAYLPFLHRFINQLPINLNCNNIIDTVGPVNYRKLYFINDWAITIIFIYLKNIITKKDRISWKIILNLHACLFSFSLIEILFLSFWLLKIWDAYIQMYMKIAICRCMHEIFRSIMIQLPRNSILYSYYVSWSFIYRLFREKHTHTQKEFGYVTLCK